MRPVFGVHIRAVHSFAVSFCAVLGFAKILLECFHARPVGRNAAYGHAGVGLDCPRDKGAPSL